MRLIDSAALLPLQTNDIVAAKKPSKLHDAAQQFEALMIGEMMRSVRESGSEGWLGSGGDTGDDSAMDMAEGQFARALATGGGLGLSKMIEQSMNRPQSEPQNVNAAGEKVSTGSDRYPPWIIGIPSAPSIAALAFVSGSHVLSNCLDFAATTRQASSSFASNCSTS